MLQENPPFHPQKTPQNRAFSGMVSIRSATDYSPFGVQLENRNFLKSGLAEDYRMGLQGQEEDDEVKGEGNSLNYAFRMHDPRLGRFFAVDPLAKDYPYYSTYQFSGNQVIYSKELEGLEPSKDANSVNAGTSELAKDHSNTKADHVFNYVATKTAGGKLEWAKGNEYKQATQEEAAKISNHVYNLDVEGYDPNGKDNKKTNVANYELISECVTPGTGFKAGLYKRTIDGVTFYVHATAGTDDENDIIEDVGQGTGLGDFQIAQSLLYAGITSSVYSSDKSAKSLTYTGHSLGGGLAAANAKKFNHQAITFNAMGIHPNFCALYKLKYKPTINAYIIKGEALNAIQIHKADGTQKFIQPKGTNFLSFDQYIKNNNINLNGINYGYYLKIAYPSYVISKSISNHSMNNFLKYDF